MVTGPACRDIGRSIEKTQKKGKEAIITEALSSGKQQAAEKDYYTLYTCYQSERGHKQARLLRREIQPTDPLDPEAALEGSSHPSMTKRQPGLLGETKRNVDFFCHL